MATKAILALFGGYIFMSGYVALSSIISIILGMELGEAVVLNSMVGYFVYLLIILWVFATVKLWRTLIIISFFSSGMIVLSLYLVKTI
jgi:hypothetical protein